MNSTKFEQFNISKELLSAITEVGYEEATPIQSEAIPVILSGKDVIGLAQTGTGKTAAFAIPVIEKIDLAQDKIQAAILCPTRELAIQVSEEIIKFSKYKKKLKVLPVYGGQPIERQLTALKRGVQIIIATPGRLVDHIDRGSIKLDHITTVVLDEADEMLNMGFRDDLEYILKEVPKNRQTILFSATMSKPILDITKRYQKEPQMIQVAHKEMTAPKIAQFYVELRENMKLDVLTRFLDIHDVRLSLIFCNTKRQVDALLTHLQARGYSVDALHGDLKQSQRDKVMERFRKGVIEVLIATDVAARGIDVDDIEVIFNYDLPQDEEYYVHRIGRTGRAGKTGKAFTFVTGKDAHRFRDIQKYTKSKVTKIAIPTYHDVEDQKINHLLEDVKEVLMDGGLTKYVKRIEDFAGSEFQIEDIAAALLKIIVLPSEDPINAEPNKKEFVSNGFVNNSGAPGMVRLYLNLGRQHKIGVKDIVGAIAGESGIPGKSIGAIDLGDKFSYVEIPNEYANQVLERMKRVQIRGHKFLLEPANKK